MPALFPQTTACAWLDRLPLPLHPSTPTEFPTAWYRFGDGYLALQSGRNRFSTRFEALFGDCRTMQPSEPDATVVHCAIEPDAANGCTRVRVAGADFDPVERAVALFADRGCQQLHAGSFTGRVFGMDGHDGATAIGVLGNELLVHDGQPWEWLIGNLTVDAVLCRQQQVAVFHAASAAIGSSGVLLVGGKGVGKTTLSMELAGRGHVLFGDEMGAVRLEALDLLPMRRALSIRLSGSTPPAITARLDAGELAPERFPDGEWRVRAAISSLYGSHVPQSVRLASIVFLEPRATEPRLERVAAGRDTLRRLTPLASTLCHLPPAVRAMRLLAILPRVPCFALTAGTPAATAALLEQTVQHSWD